MGEGFSSSREQGNETYVKGVTACEHGEIYTAECPKLHLQDIVNLLGEQLWRRVVLQAHKQSGVMPPANV
jgi:hypothetical protein